MAEGENIDFRAFSFENAGTGTVCVSSLSADANILPVTGCDRQLQVHTTQGSTPRNDQKRRYLQELADDSACGGFTDVVSDCRDICANSEAERVDSIATFPDEFSQRKSRDLDNPIAQSTTDCKSERSLYLFATENELCPRPLESSEDEIVRDAIEALDVQASFPDHSDSDQNKDAQQTHSECESRDVPPDNASPKDCMLQVTSEDKAKIVCPDDVADPAAGEETGASSSSRNPFSPLGHCSPFESGGPLVCYSGSTSSASSTSSFRAARLAKFNGNLEPAFSNIENEATEKNSENSASNDVNDLAGDIRTERTDGDARQICHDSSERLVHRGGDDCETGSDILPKDDSDSHDRSFDTLDLDPSQEHFHAESPREVCFTKGTTVPAANCTTVPAESPRDVSSTIGTTVPAESPREISPTKGTTVPAESPREVSSTKGTTVPAANCTTVPAESPREGNSTEGTTVPAESSREVSSTKGATVPAESPREVSSTKGTTVPAANCTTVPAESPREVSSTKGTTVPAEYLLEVSSTKGRTVPAESPREVSSTEGATVPAANCTSVPAESPQEVSSTKGTTVPAESPREVTSTKGTTVPAESPREVSSTKGTTVPAANCDEELSTSECCPCPKNANSSGPADADALNNVKHSESLVEEAELFDRPDITCDGSHHPAVVASKDAITSGPVDDALDNVEHIERPMEEAEIFDRTDITCDGSPLPSKEEPALVEDHPDNAPLGVKDPVGNSTDPGFHDSGEGEVNPSDESVASASGFRRVSSLDSRPSNWLEFDLEAEEGSDADFTSCVDVNSIAVLPAVEIEVVLDVQLGIQPPKLSEEAQDVKGSGTVAVECKDEPLDSLPTPKQNQKSPPAQDLGQSDVVPHTDLPAIAIEPIPKTSNSPQSAGQTVFDDLGSSDSDNGEDLYIPSVHGTGQARRPSSILSSQTSSIPDRSELNDHSQPGTAESIGDSVVARRSAADLESNSGDDLASIPELPEENHHQRSRITSTSGETGTASTSSSSSESSPTGECRKQKSWASPVFPSDGVETSEPSELTRSSVLRNGKRVQLTEEIDPGGKNEMSSAMPSASQPRREDSTNPKLAQLMDEAVGEVAGNQSKTSGPQPDDRSQGLASGSVSSSDSRPRKDSRSVKFSEDAVECKMFPTEDNGIDCAVGGTEGATNAAENGSAVVPDGDDEQDEALEAEWDEVEVRTEEVRAREAGRIRNQPSDITVKPITLNEVQQWLLRDVLVDPTSLEKFQNDEVTYSSCFRCISRKRYLSDVPGLDRKLLRDKDLVLFLSVSDFDFNTVTHVRMLRTMYVKLTRNKLCGQIGHHWEVFGFQHTDPRTDLNRSGGVLNVYHMFTAFANNLELLKAIFQLAQDQEQHFPLACVSINISRMVVDCLLHGKLSKVCNASEKGVLDSTCQIYSGALFHFYTRWRTQKRNIEDTDRAFKELKQILDKKPGSLLTGLESGMRELKSRNDPSRHEFTQVDFGSAGIGDQAATRPTTTPSPVTRRFQAYQTADTG